MGWHLRAVGQQPAHLPGGLQPANPRRWLQGQEVLPEPDAQQMIEELNTALLAQPKEAGGAGGREV